MLEHPKRGVGAPTKVASWRSPIFWTAGLSCLLVIGLVAALIHSVTASSKNADRASDEATYVYANGDQHSPSAQPSASMSPSASPTPSPSPTPSSEASSSTPTPAAEAAPAPNAGGGKGGSGTPAGGSTGGGTSSNNQPGSSTTYSRTYTQSSTSSSSSSSSNLQAVAPAPQQAQSHDVTWATYCTRSQDGSSVTAYLVLYNAPSSWVATARAGMGPLGSTSASQNWTRSTVTDSSRVACSFTVNGSIIDSGQAA